MTNILTYEQWEATYQPMPNSIVEDDNFGYETYGEELEYVKLQNDHNIWTELDGDDGVSILNGFYVVNRIKYYITKTAWRDCDNLEVHICKFVICDCFNVETDEADADCDQCGGDGTYTDWM